MHLTKHKTALSMNLPTASHQPALDNTFWGWVKDRWLHCRFKYVCLAFLFNHFTSWQEDSLHPQQWSREASELCWVGISKPALVAWIPPPGCASAAPPSHCRSLFWSLGFASKACRRNCAHFVSNMLYFLLTATLHQKRSKEGHWEKEKDSAPKMNNLTLLTPKKGAQQEKTRVSLSLPWAPCTVSSAAVIFLVLSHSSCWPVLSWASVTPLGVKEEWLEKNKHPSGPGSAILRPPPPDLPSFPSLMHSELHFLFKIL